MKLAVLDFETYYDREYSLSKITTEEYIRDDRFEIILVGLKLDDGPTEWFSGTLEQTRDWLLGKGVEDRLVVAHNNMFDAAILSWRLGIFPKRLGCTLNMARALYGPAESVSLASMAKKHGLQEKGTAVHNMLGRTRASLSASELREYAEYCVGDVDICHQLFRLFVDEHKFPLGELKVIDATLRMFSEPVLELDLPLLEQHLQDVRDRKEALLAAADADKSVLMSNPKFAALLQSHGVDPPTKISPTTKQRTWAFSKADEKFRALQEHPNEAVQALVAARLGTKSTLEETRTERFIGIAKRGKFPVPLNYAAAISHRWSGADSINLQNLPSRGKGVNTLKRSIKAPEGYVVIDCDSSQIEARVLAWLAGQQDLVELFEAQDSYTGDPTNKPDVYKDMAAKIYTKPPPQIDKPERDVGKATVLGCGYGMGAPKFSLMLNAQGIDTQGISPERIISVYRLHNPEIVNFWYHCHDILHALAANRAARVGRTGAVWASDGMIILPNGMPIRYPDLRMAQGEFIYSTRRGPARIYGPKLVENICQAVARCIIAEQLVKIHRRYKVVLTVHDAIACIAPISEAEDAVSYVERVMRTTPEWAVGLPLNCESGYGQSYGDC